MQLSPLEPEARQFVLNQLADSQRRLLTALEDLTSTQWHFRESPDRWSISENLEHLIAFEAFIRGAIERAIKTAPAPENRADVAAKDPLVVGLATSRDIRFTAREIVRPLGRWSTPAAMIEEFRATRAETIIFAATTEAPLRDHFFPHIAFGDLDCYQWLIVLAQHTERHVAQIEQVMTDPGFPPS